MAEENKGIPKAASNIDEFNEQARSFVIKARQKGVSNTAIANTIKLMYGMFEAEQSRKITPYQQAQLDMQQEEMQMKRDLMSQEEWSLREVDGRPAWVNERTQEIRPAEMAGAVPTDEYSITDEEGPQAERDLLDLTGDSDQARQVTQPIQGQQVYNQPMPQEEVVTFRDIAQRAGETFGPTARQIGEPIAQTFAPRTSQFLRDITSAIGNKGDSSSKEPDEDKSWWEFWKR